MPKTPHEKKFVLGKKNVYTANKWVMVPPLPRATPTPTNQPTNQMKTTTILFRNEAGTWTLARYKGGIVPSSEHATAKAARDYAKTKNWQVRRATNCDA